MKNKAKWIKRQQEIVDAARAAGQGLTAEEQAEFDALQRQIDAEPDDNGGGGEPAGPWRLGGGRPDRERGPALWRRGPYPQAGGRSGVKGERAGAAKGGAVVAGGEIP